MRNSTGQERLVSLSTLSIEHNLSRQVNFDDIINIWPEMSSIDASSREQIEIESQYLGYLKRQREDINDFKKDDSGTLFFLSNGIRKTSSSFTKICNSIK